MYTSFPFSRLDGKHCVFGQVIEGLEDVIPKLESYGCDSGKTSKKIKIEKCGTC